MRKLLAVIVVGIVPAVAMPAAVRAAEGTSAIAQPASGATFELTYRGLAGPDDPMSYRSYWGFGQEKAETPFLTAAKKRVKQSEVVCNTQLPEAMRWSLVELKDGSPVALYFDADGDGKLSDGERFPSVPVQKPNLPNQCVFVPSDLMTRTADGKEAPFRVMLTAYRGDPKSPLSYMWSPSCVLEGQATLAGEPMKLVLYANGFDGAFSTFRSASFALFPADQKVEGYLPRESLSSLICYKGTFYRLKLDGAHEKDKTLRVTLDKDTTPTGTIKMELAGRESLKGRLMSAMILGTADKTVYFRTQENQTTLPAGAYQLANGYLSYGVARDDEWRVNFSDGAGFTVAAAETSAIKMGELALSVSAVAEKDSGRPNVKPTSTFPKGTAISISPQIKGKAGEIYMRFTRQGSQAAPSGVLSRLVSWAKGSPAPGQSADVKPHLTIADPGGKKIVSKDLEYG